MTEPPPTTTLVILTTRLLLILGDTEANRFVDDITDEAFRLALAEYSYAVPNLITATHTVTEAEREQVLPVASSDPPSPVLFPGLISITQVIFPWNDESQYEQLPHPQYYFYFTDGAPVVYIDGPRLPQAGDLIRITYAAAHTIDDLNDAKACTVPAHDFELILQGAAGHAARLRTAIYNESFSAHPELKTFALDNLAQFRSTLRQLRRQSARQPLPPVGFKLDQWDGG